MGTPVESPLSQGPARSQWRGVWTWSEETAADRNVYALFRRGFSLDGPGELHLAVTADSEYVLYVDGEFVTRGPARAPLEYYLYDEIAVPLSPGAHCLAILAHHVGEVNACMRLGRPGLLVDGYVEGAGGQLDLSSGPTWRCYRPTAWRRDLPELMSHFGFWEDCDLSQLPHGWTLPGFDDAEWATPVTIGAPPCPPWQRLIARDIPVPVYSRLPGSLVGAGDWEETQAQAAIPSVQVAARRRTPQAPAGGFPLTLTLASEGGQYLTVDFGRTVSGYVEIEFADAPAGVQLDLSYDEMLTPEAAVNPERSYAHLTDRYRLAGGSGRLRPVHPRGFRYVTLDMAGASTVEIAGVTAVEETYPFTVQASFTTPDEQLMSFVRRGAETVRICTTDAFTDCPTRERVQWMGDLQLQARVAVYAFGDTQMLRHALFQGAQGALPDGRINGFFPTDRTNLAWAVSSLMWLHSLVDYWLYAGNEDIHRLLPTAERLLEFLSTQTDGTGLIRGWPAGQFWGWAPLEEEGCLLLTNAAYLWALARMAEQPLFRGVVGDDAAARLDHLRRTAHAEFWDPARQYYRDVPMGDPRSPIYSQQANTLAVLAGICPPDQRQALLRRVIDPTRLGPVPVGEATLRAGPRPSPDQLVPMGTLWFAQFLCQALFEADLDEEALAQMRYFWGAYDYLPTFPETRIQHGNTTHCHGWAGGPAYLLPAYVLGVQPVAPGWSAVRVSPHPGGLTEAHGVFATPQGPLEVAWTRRDEQLSLQIEAPAGLRVV